jgi:hypothetical protein
MPAIIMHTCNTNHVLYSCFILHSAEASLIAKSTACKVFLDEIAWPRSHDADSMHTVKDVVEKLLYLIIGNDILIINN